MLKAVLLATSMLVAAPAFAQDKPATETTQPQQQTPPATQAPATTDDAAPGTQGSGTVEEAPAATTPPATEAAQPTPTQPAPTQPAPAQPEPAQPGTAPATAPTPDAAGTTGAGTTAAAQPAASQDQVAQAVSRDFGTYDKDSNGMLSDVEFGAWMGTLRKASEPSFAPGSPEAGVWLGQAFAAADADKSKSINQAELTTFLTPKPS